MKRVLVTDATERSALAITRSLGKKGITIITCGTGNSSLSSHSRYCTKSHHFLHAVESAPQDYIDFVNKIVNEEQIDAIFPVTDLSIDLFLNNWNEITAGNNVVAIAPPLNCYNAASDKNNLFRVATQIGLEVPDYVEFTSSLDLHIDSLNLEYPVVIKPCKSIVYYDNKILKTSVKIAKNRNDLENKLRESSYLENTPFTLQKFIPGSGAGIFAFYNQGNNLGFFAHRRLREKPPTGGVSVLSESTLPTESLQSRSKLLLDKLQWSGLAMVEYRISVGNVPYLMEINGRPWGSIQLAIDSGFDFPYLAYLSAFNKPLEPILQYHVGNKLRWLLGDLDRLYLVIKSDVGFQRKMSETLSFLNFFDKNTRFEVNRMEDLKPFLHELKSYVRQLF